MREGELAGRVVGAAGQHQRVDAPRLALGEHGSAGRPAGARRRGTGSPRRAPAARSSCAARTGGSTRRARSPTSLSSLPKLFMKLASAKLRKPVAASEAATSSSKPIGSPHRLLISASMSALRVDQRSRSRSATAMAPALMKGLRGLPCSCSSCTSELNGLPDGSRPMRSHSASPSALHGERQREQLGDALDRERRGRVAGAGLLRRRRCAARCRTARPARAPAPGCSWRPCRPAPSCGRISASISSRTGWKFMAGAVGFTGRFNRCARVCRAPSATFARCGLITAGHFFTGAPHAHQDQNRG